MFHSARILNILRSTGFLAGAIVCGTLSLAATAGAFESVYLGSLDQGPLAPTSLQVGETGIAALEPYTGQLELFTAEGVLSAKVRIDSNARGLAQLGERSFLYCDRDGARIVRVDLASGEQTEWLNGAAEPVDVIVEGQECFVLDAAQRRILVCDAAGTVTARVDLAVPGGQPGGWLSDLARDRGRDLFYVLDQTASAIQAYDRDGRFLGAFASFGNGDGEISRGGELTCDADGWIYVTDRYQGRVLVFDESWAFAGNVDPQRSGAPALAVPTGLAVDAAGILYVASTEGAAIQMYRIGKGTSSIGELLTSAISPTAGDSLPMSALRFSVGVTAPASLVSSLVVDFRITDRSDPDRVVAEENGLPMATSSVVEDLAIGTAVWEPEVVLESDGQYAWQARTRAGALTGPWMQPRDFELVAPAARFALDQNFPNPFNPSTTIFFELTGTGAAKLAVYDLRGRQVWARDVSGFGAGRHDLPWGGLDDTGAAVSTGVYFYALTEGDLVQTRKMILMK